MVLTVSFVLSPVTGLFCHRRPRFRELDASVGASGPHDFAVREISAHVQRAACVHRIPFRVDDVGQRPSVARDVRLNASDLPDVLSGIFFAEGLDTPQSERDLICPSGSPDLRDCGPAVFFGLDRL
jgi:hypothetical protein